jgi:hypothetical protein
MGGVGSVVETVAVALGDNELRGRELGQLGLDGAEGEAAAAGEIAEVELGGGVGEEEAQHFGPDFREEDGEEVRHDWLIRSDDWIKRSDGRGKREGDLQEARRQKSGLRRRSEAAEGHCEGRMRSGERGRAEADKLRPVTEVSEAEESTEEPAG